MTLAMTASLAVVRGPVAVAKSLAAIDLLSGGRLIAAIGAGSSQRDYEAVGVPFAERWARYDAALVDLRALLRELQPARPAIPLWVASWGSKAGLRRVATAGDGWLASAYNTTPERFAAGLEQLGAMPNALATMWTWVTDDRAGRRARPARRAGAPAAARSRRAAHRDVHRPARALRRAALALRRGRLPARLPLAAGRRAAPARADRERGQAGAHPPSARAACVRHSSIAVTAGPR